MLFLCHVTIENTILIIPISNVMNIMYSNFMENHLLSIDRRNINGIC